MAWIRKTPEGGKQTEQGFGPEAVYWEAFECL